MSGFEIEMRLVSDLLKRAMSNILRDDLDGDLAACAARDIRKGRVII